MALTQIDLEFQSKDNTLVTAKIKDLQITTAKIADDAVTVDKLRDDAAIDSNRAVTTNHIRDNAIITQKITDDAVTAAKLNVDTAGAGLTQDGGGALQVNTDNSTLEINADTVRVKAQGITANELLDTLTFTQVFPVNGDHDHFTVGQGGSIGIRRVAFVQNYNDIPVTASATVKVLSGGTQVPSGTSADVASQVLGVLINTTRAGVVSLSTPADNAVIVLNRKELIQLRDASGNSITHTASGKEIFAVLETTSALGAAFSTAGLSGDGTQLIFVREDAVDPNGFKVAALPVGVASPIEYEYQERFTLSTVPEDYASHKGAFVEQFGNVDVTVQRAYENTVSEPELTTNGTRGALSIRRGSAADSDQVLAIENGGGTVKAHITGAGTLTLVDGPGFLILGSVALNATGADPSNGASQVGITTITNITPVSLTVMSALKRIGDAFTSGNLFVDREVPSGTINGVNTVFTLAFTPLSGSEYIYKNGLLQNVGGGNDYSIAGGTITFTTPPQSGDILLTSYRKLY